MKRIAAFVLILSFAVQAEAQYMRRSKGMEKMYFVTVGYGVGSAKWFSNMGNAELYDLDGSVIQSGDLKYRMDNSTKVINLEVCAPIKKVRLGMGISFEEYFLDKMVIKDAIDDGSHLVFNESFRFDKMYLQLQVPFDKLSGSNFSVGLKEHIGYFGFTGVENINFFGEEALAKTYFVNTGAIAHYRLFPHTYVYVNPSIEYKYFNNSKLERPASINHNIITFSIVGGLRFDVSNERN